MKKLFKLGFVSLLLSSLVVTSGCYKKDIDDLEKRVDELEKLATDHKSAIAALQTDVAALKTAESAKLVEDVVVGSDNYQLEIKYSNGTSTKITVKAPATPTTPTSTIVKDFKFNEEFGFWEIQIYKSTKTEDGYYVVRIGQDFSNAANYGSKFVRQNVVAEVGKDAYAIVDINPSGFELDKDKIDFDYAGEIATRAAATGLKDKNGKDLGITVKSVVRASEFIETEANVAIWKSMFEGKPTLTALEGRWIITFNYTKKATAGSNPKFSLLVQFPKDGASFNGIWEGGKEPAVKAEDVVMQYSISNNEVYFTDRVVNVKPNMLVIDPASAEINSDESYTGTVKIKLSEFNSDPSVYLQNPTIVVSNTVTRRTDRFATTETTLTGPALTAALSYLKDLDKALAEPASVSADEAYRNYKDFTLTMVDDDQIPAGPMSVFPVGSRLTYQITVTAQDYATPTAGTTTSNVFTFRVWRVRNVYDIPNPVVTSELGRFYIPVVATTELGSYSSLIETGKLYTAFQAMGFSLQNIEAAEFKGVTTETQKEVDGQNVWVASNEPFTATYADGLLKVSVANTVSVGPNGTNGVHRVTYNFTIGGRDVKVRDIATVVPPTVYVRLKNTTVDDLVVPNTVSVIGAASGDPTVTAVVYTSDKDEPLDLTKIFNLEAGAVKTGRTYIPYWNPTVPEGYQFSGITLGGNTGGLVADPASVPVAKGTNAGKAQLVKLTVTLTTGQVLPVIVNGSTFVDAWYNAHTQYQDWTNGKFYIAVQGNKLIDIALDVRGGADLHIDEKLSLGEVIAEAVEVDEALRSASFLGTDMLKPVADRLEQLVEWKTISIPVPGTDQTVNHPISGYERILNDPRVAKVEFAPGDILDRTSNPVIAESIESFFTIEHTTKIVKINKPGPIIGDEELTFDRVTPIVLLKGVNENLTYWTADQTKQQELKVTVTDIFGNSVTKKVNLTFTHNNM